MSVSAVLGDSLRGLSGNKGVAGSNGDPDSFANALRRASDAGSKTIGTATPSPNAEQLSSQAENQLSEFKRAIQQLFASAGVHTSSEVRLQSDGAGGITVGDHPDRDAIMKVLKDNPDLVDKFNKLQTTYKQLRGTTDQPDDADSLFSPVFNVKFVDDEAHAAFD